MSAYSSDKDEMYPKKRSKRKEAYNVNYKEDRDDIKVSKHGAVIDQRSDTFGENSDSKAESILSRNNNKG